MICVVYWLYRDARSLLRGPRVYTAAHVNAQLAPLKRHMPGPYRVVCVTDDPSGIDPSVEVVPMPCDDGEHEIHDSRNPPCLRRLWNFSREARLLGERIIALDLDGFAVRSLRLIAERDEPLVVWRTARGMIQGCGYLLTTGTHAHVWESFLREPNPMQTLRVARCSESDQGWLNYILGRDTPSFGDEVWCPGFTGRELPQSAALVSFDTPYKPWHREARERFRWIEKHYELCA